MKLKIVDFIKTHSNWEELLTSSPYNLTIKRDGKLILFKYNQIDSDFNEEICCEARGLILEEGTWKVVRFAFKKFFNLGESFAAKIDWDSAVGNEKLDGSIISVFFYDGKWRIATNSTINAFQAELGGIGPYKTFGELFESVLPLSTFTNYNKHRCWTFELVSPYNKVVIDYPEAKVYLLSVRDMDSLEELGLNAVEMLADANGLTVPQRYNLNNEEEYRQLVASMPEGHEGIVVRDKNGERVKIKTLLYFQLHRTANNGKLTLERIIDLIKTNDTDEFLAYFREYEQIFADVRERIEVCWNNVSIIQIQATGLRNMLESQFSQKVARKEFAHIVEDKVAKPLWFIAYDGDLKKRVESYTTPQFIRAFSYIFKGYLD